MNAFYFYPTVASTFLAALTFRTSPSSNQRATDQPTVQREMETTWIAAENDSDRYRAKSMEEIEAYSLILRGMATRSEQGEFASRDYLRTRLQSLREHIDYARAEALKLPSSGGDGGFTPAYGHFHRTLMNLQGAFSQTAEELANGA